MMPCLFIIIFLFTDFGTLMSSAFKKYEETYFYRIIRYSSYIDTLLVAPLAISSTTLFSYYVVHEFFQLKLLNQRIQSIETDLEIVPEDERITSIFYQNVIYERLRECIVHHINLRQLV